MTLVSMVLALIAWKLYKVRDMGYFSYKNTGIARGVASVTPNDSTDNVPEQCIGFYAGSGGDVSIITEAGDEVVIPIASRVPIYIAITRIKSTGTTATELFALKV